jgi:predicted alpha/beta-fold hydrolase
MFVLAAVAFLPAAPCSAATDYPVAVETPVAQADYYCPYENPLYASIAGYQSARHVKVAGEREYKLQAPRMGGPVEVHAVLQGCSAPLVVLLPGLTGSSNSDFTRLWPSWFAEAGCHVLYFDSTFLTAAKAKGQPGVSGNLFAEAELSRDIIAAFLEQAGAAQQVTRIGIVGMSYGGNQALALGQMAEKGLLPFKLDAVQAYSPPIDLKQSAQILDRWFAEDRPQYTLVQMRDLQSHKPLESCGAQAPFSDCKMRAGIAAVFRESLADVVVANDRTYRLNLLPRGDDFNDPYVRRDHALSWSFMDYAYDMALPYWRQKQGLASVDDLVDRAGLCELLKRQPSTTETILTADDPLNTPGDLARLRACMAEGRVTLLPNGGHLGYVNNPWTRAKLLSMFGLNVTRPVLSSR